MVHRESFRSAKECRIGIYEKKNGADAHFAEAKIIIIVQKVVMTHNAIGTVSNTRTEDAGCSVNEIPYHTRPCCGFY